MASASCWHLYCNSSSGSSTSRCLDFAASLFFANFCNLNVSSGDLAKISISSVVLSFAAFFKIPETSLVVAFLSFLRII